MFFDANRFFAIGRRGSRVRAAIAGAGLSVLLAGSAVRAQTPEEEIFPGRVPAAFMSYRGAGWLERPDREQTERPDAVIEAMALEAGDVVADIGCGSGYFTRRMARQVAPEGKVYGVDIQPEMLEIMGEIIEREGVTGIVPVLSEPGDPKLPPEAMDWILLVDVYHEFGDAEAMLAGMRRALKPDGRVALLEYRVEDGTGDHIKPDHRMSVRQVLSEWKRGGFELVDLLEHLPTQHMFIFRRAGGPAEEVIQDFSLLEAMEEGIVSARAAASDAESVIVQIEKSDSSGSVIIHSRVGTYFAAQDGQRDMIARRDGMIFLKQGGREEMIVRCASADGESPIPAAPQRFQIRPPSERLALGRLMHYLQGGGVPPEAEQAAVWIAAADASYEQLRARLKGEYLQAPDAIGYGLVYCERAGIDVTGRRVWADRQEISEALRVRDLKNWFAERTGN